MSLKDLKNTPKVVGIKQVRKAIDKNQTKVVYIASDAEPHIITPIKTACLANRIEIREAESMAELGKACGIKVGSAVVALLND